MKLKLGSFCGLSRNPDWHGFLKSISPSIYDNFMKFLSTNKGCRTAKDKMTLVYQEIYKIGKGQQFEDFIADRFPYIIDGTPPKPTLKPPVKMPHKVDRKPQVVVPPPILHVSDSDDKLNKHGVFKLYKPNMLMFPQKLILVDKDPATLQKKVTEFLADKVGTDYIIIDDTAYIEYFLEKYRDEVDKIPNFAREVMKYRLNHK